MNQENDQQSIFDDDLEKLTNSFIEFANKHNIPTPVFIIRSKDSFFIGHDTQKDNLYDVAKVLKDSLTMCIKSINLSLGAID